MTGYESKRAAAQEKLAQPAQEPVAWATKEDFYRELDRRVERMRKEMEIKTVTMRCKDYDVALPIIDTAFGHVLVGQVSFPPQPAQEPVAWMYPDALCDRACLYVCTKAFTQFPECATTPPQPAQEPVAWMVYTLDGASVCVTDNPADFTPEHRALPLYTASAIKEALAQPSLEQNFCPRCGKRTKDIHTCTPPSQENT